MAAPVVNELLTNVTQATSTTGWTGFKLSGAGSAPTPQLENDIVIEGTAAISVKVSGSGRDQGLWFDNGAGIDFTVTGRHLWIWANNTTPSNEANVESNGFYVAVSTSGNEGTDYLAWNVFGRNKQPSGWERIVLDLNKKPSRSVGSTDLTDINFIGVGITQSGSVKSENLVCDRIDYGTGLQIEEGTASDPCTWQKLYDDDNIVTNKFGVIDKRGSIFFLRGEIQIGDESGTAPTRWIDDSGAVLEWEDPQYHNGDALVSAIDGPNLYKITVQGNTTGITDVVWGETVGTGDAAQGINGGQIRSAGPKWTFDAETHVADLEQVALYGMQFQGSGIVAVSGGIVATVIGCQFVNCDEIQPNDAIWVNNFVIAPIPDRGMELLIDTAQSVKLTKFVYGGSNFAEADRVWQVDVSPTPDGFVDETDDFNSAATADVGYFPGGSGAAGDYCAFGSVHKFTRLRIVTSQGGTVGVIVWEYWNGSIWSALENLEDETIGLTAAAGTYDVDWRLSQDWAAVSLNGECPLFYIRARVTTAFTITPVGTSGTVRRLVEHLVNHPATSLATLTFDGLEFFGTGTAKFDVEASGPANVRSFYAYTNQDALQALGNGTIDGVAQAWANGTGAHRLSRVRVLLSMTGTVTGELVCKLYAHSGTFGTSSIPTGAALATSNIVDVADITANLIQWDFEFEDDYLMTASTNYVFAIEMTTADGDGSNHINVGYDSSIPLFGGNKSTLASSTWTPQSGHDVPHNVWANAIIHIENINGADADTSQSTNDAPGAIIKTTPATYTLVDIVIGSELRIFRASDQVELAGIEVTVSSTFAYNHDGAVVPIYVILQKLTHEWLRIDDTLGPADATVTVSQQPDINYENP